MVTDGPTWTAPNILAFIYHALGHPLGKGWPETSPSLQQTVREVQTLKVAWQNEAKIPRCQQAGAFSHPMAMQEGQSPQGGCVPYRSATVLTMSGLGYSQFRTLCKLQVRPLVHLLSRGRRGHSQRSAHRGNASLSLCCSPQHFTGISLFLDWSRLSAMWSPRWTPHGCLCPDGLSTNMWADRGQPAVIVVVDRCWEKRRG